MPDTAKTRERLAKLTAICLALPEAVREDQESHASFRVAKKVFAYYLNDHHSDGIVSVCCKALPGDNERLIASNPRKFYMPAYIGPRGWVGLAPRPAHGRLVGSERTGAWQLHADGAEKACSSCSQRSERTESQAR